MITRTEAHRIDKRLVLGKMGPSEAGKSYQARSESRASRQNFNMTAKQHTWEAAVPSLPQMETQA